MLGRGSLEPIAVAADEGQAVEEAQKLAEVGMFRSKSCQTDPKPHSFRRFKTFGVENLGLEQLLQRFRASPKRK